MSNKKQTKAIWERERERERERSKHTLPNRINSKYCYKKYNDSSAVTWSKKKEEGLSKVWFDLKKKK